MIIMGYMSVKDAAEKFNISERRVQKLCESNRISGAEMLSGVWVIPVDAIKPSDERMVVVSDETKYITLNELCDDLSISTATGRNWVKLGKLIPSHMEKKMPIFTREYAIRIKKDIQSGKNGALKSRRNKKFVYGNALYNSYVSDNCNGISEVQGMLEEIGEMELELSSERISYIVAEVALHLFVDRLNLSCCDRESLLVEYLERRLDIGKYNNLILDLIDNKEEAIYFSKKYNKLLKHEYCYEAGEDLLGLIYISCKKMCKRKATGSYYTPTVVVKKLIEKMHFDANTKIMDPCCGTGNFLMQLPDDHDFNNIYGTDIDKISAQITRINMALKYLDASVETIYAHIMDKDYLDDGCIPEMDYIIGNPPWGFEYSEIEKKRLKELFSSASGKNIESYDVFTEQALKNLKLGGSVLYVLPEAFLNVKAHTSIREIVIQSNSITHLEFLGNAFDGVQCPCIIFGVEYTGKSLTTLGMHVVDGNREFEIRTERSVSSDYFSFITTDEEYKIIEKLCNRKNVVYLKNNADFALGIVTGNNKEFISNEKNDNNEIVLKGSDICKYRVHNTDNYITFKPESFQQVAPTEVYRAEERLLYRFICRQLVFAYDDKQTLSLNSCNILIPRIEGLDIKYVMAVLNSRIAQFIFSKSFNSVKILRSHIEAIPIPKVDAKTQEEIIEIVNEILQTQSESQIEELYDLVDEKISQSYGLDSQENEIIKRVVDDGNKFLL